MSLPYIASFAFLNFLKLVDAKECMLYDGTKYLSFHCSIYEYCCGTRCCRSPAITFYQLWYFCCSIYEYCCGTRCCRSPAITFYQLWYFWLMVFLTILFCSGGGWWYRLRDRDTFMTPSMASRVTHTRPAVHPAQGSTIYTTSSVPMTQAPNITQYPPPPPYYGPPPSYDTVVYQNPPPQQFIHTNQALPPVIAHPNQAPRQN